MNFENHMHNTKTHLAMAQSKVESHDYDTALAALTEAYSNVRMMIELIWVCKVAAEQANLSELPDTETPLECLQEPGSSSNLPAGENTGGP